MSEGSFECKVSGRRESANGIFLTLQINPADLTTDLAMLRVGSALMVGWSEVVDVVVHKIEIGDAAGIGQLAPVKYMTRKELEDTYPAKPRTPFSELKLSQQAGIRCGDKSFQEFMVFYFSGLHAYAATEENAIALLREQCEVSSRSEFDTNKLAAETWRDIESSFQRWLTDKMYETSKR